MRHLIFLICLLSAIPIWAKSSLTTQIYDIDYGRDETEDTLVLLTSGHVAKLKKDNRLMWLKKRNKSSLQTDQWFHITMDKDRYIIQIQETESPFSPEEVKQKTVEKFLNRTYVPTTVESMAKAQQYHRQGRRDYNGETQCFNRGMVWSYEWWKKNSVKSMKYWVFFTRNYIRRYNFEWWFHIAPYLHVMHEGKVVERAMDLKYTSGPVDLRRWTNIFMRNDAECKIVTKYSDYADYPYTGDCYVMRSSMYVYQPADLEMNEAWGYTKDSFLMDEVRGAYLEAFGVRL
ncbi:MAG TPA: protein-glutamine glutaminase family protein [Bacteriovoracaceae bacterium]|nr:protein-glutamine glutaminase family protein [Bacteriovoracaceae bacterium]